MYSRDNVKRKLMKTTEMDIKELQAHWTIVTILEASTFRIFGALLYPTFNKVQFTMTRLYFSFPQNNIESVVAPGAVKNRNWKQFENLPSHLSTYSYMHSNTDCKTDLSWYRIFLRGFEQFMTISTDMSSQRCMWHKVLIGTLPI